MLTLTKIQGTGNDFLIIDCRAQNLSNAQELTKRLCHRNYGVGADGLILIKDSESADLKWDFYNSDGSSAEMCGNAARCMGRWAQLNNFNLPFKLETLSGVVTISSPSSDLFSVKMAGILKDQPETDITINGENLTLHLIDTGVPHAVIETKNNKFTSYKALCADIRNHSQFQPTGTNVTLYIPLGQQSIQSVSFERGVENFTLACGTGAVAAAYARHCKTKENLITVQVPGGDLKVDFSGEKPILIGPAEFVFNLEIEVPQ